MRRFLILCLIALLPALTAVAQVTDAQYQALYEEFFGYTGQTHVLEELLPTVYADNGTYATQGNLDAIARYIARHEADTARAERLTCCLLQGMAALYYRALGRTAETEQQLVQAMDRLRTVSHYEREPLYADLLDGLGSFYAGVVDTKAAHYYILQKERCEAQLDFNAYYIRALSCLAGYYARTVNGFLGKMYIDRALSAMRDVPDLDPEVQLQIWLQASLVYSGVGLAGEAQAYSEQCKRLLEEENVEFSLPTYLTSLVQQYQGGNFDGAKYMAREVVEELQSIGYKSSMLNILPLLMASEYCTHDSSATVTATEYLNQLIQETARRFAFLSSRERSEVWEQQLYGLQLSQYIWAQDETPQTAALYQSALFGKGLLLRASTHIMEAAAQAGGQTLECATRMKATRERLTQGRVPRDSIALLEDSIERWDKYLTQHLTGYTSPMQWAQECDWYRIVQCLDTTEAAIEFVAIPDTIDPQWTATPPMRYYALVLRHDDVRPTLVPLCREAELDEVMKKDQRLVAKTGGLKKYVRQLYTENGGSRLYHGDQMYRLVWEPLEAAFEGARTVYYSPVGLLNKVAFSALCSEGTYVGDRYTLRQVTSTREVTQRAAAQPIRSAHLYGGVDYMGKDSTLRKAAREATRGLAVPAASSELPTTRGSEWHFLPGTLEEQVYLDSLLRARKVRVVALDSLKANEESLKHIEPGTHDLLHIGTHGYYLPADEAARTATFFERLQDAGRTDDAMLRSGIILAGGNRAWTGRDVIPDIEDGIVTAREIANIDLRGTQLCVLSACETALGDIRGTEGVIGLQRALKLAGVETIVMTLWQVDDQATSLFMRTFYTSLLTSGDRHKAFRQAVDTVRAQERFASPYYWAPFVMLD